MRIRTRIAQELWLVVHDVADGAERRIERVVGEVTGPLFDAAYAVDRAANRIQGGLRRLRDHALQKAARLVDYKDWVVGVPGVPTDADGADDIARAEVVGHLILRILAVIVQILGDEERP